MPKYQISCTVETHYLADESHPDDDLFVFAYTITLTNTGSVAAQVIARHWDIEDAQGQTQVVDGLGVVGYQPLLQPGEAFEYSSSARLHTPMGIMSGYYFCVAVDGHRFETPVAPFVLRTRGAGNPSNLH